MKFEEKLQELRRSKGITQEELAKYLFVSRTAISKWESGKGYPSIDTLKQVADFYDVSLDNLLSNDELILLAKDDTNSKKMQFLNLLFGLLDLLLIIYFFVPLFGYTNNNVVYEVSLINLEDSYLYILIPYYILIITSIVGGLYNICTQNSTNQKVNKIKLIFSLSLSIVGTLLFMLTLQPYAGALTLAILVIKGIFIIKNQMTR
ncbi:MAG: helix-turn-helix transcriptional regulator [Bacilli bacterium]